MKKLFCIVLVVLMLFAFSACTPSNQGGTETTPEVTPEVTKTPTPAGYKVYTEGGISFAYPESWKNDVDGLLQDASGNGNNISIVSGAKDESHYDLTLEKYNSDYKPAYEAMGMTVVNATVDQVQNNNGMRITKIVQNMSYMGVTMKQTQYTLTVGDKTYSVTVTEVVSDATLAENVFQTLDKVG